MDLKVRNRSETTTPPSTTWETLLVVTAVVVAAVDVFHFALLGEVILPLAAGVVLTGAGVVLIRRRPRAGVVVLGLTSLALLVGSAPFALPHLPHPESGIDFTVAVTGTAGRVLAIVAAVGAWRQATEATGRRVATVATGLLAATIAVAGVASFVTAGADPRGGDVRAEIRSFAFPREVRVARGGTAFVDNRDLFRHTFTVAGTDVHAELPPKTGTRLTVDLAPGIYELICAVPGHETMTATLRVE